MRFCGKKISLDNREWESESESVRVLKWESVRRKGERWSMSVKVKTARARGQYQQQFQNGYQANKKTQRTYPFSKMSDERKQKRKQWFFQKNSCSGTNDTFICVWNAAFFFCARRNIDSMLFFLLGWQSQLERLLILNIYY